MRGDTSLVGKKVRVVLIKSRFGRLPAQRGTILALGLNKTGSSNELMVSPAVCGMINAVAHLVEVKEIN